MTLPSPTAYHRWLGWHAPALRRFVLAAAVGLAAGLTLAAVVTWQLAVLGGWDGTALVFLLTVAPVILRADGAMTAHLARREDVNRDTARLLLLAVSGASLVAVGFALGMARQEGGAERLFIVTTAALTVVISWTVLNVVFTLRYAHLYYDGPPSIDFGDPGAGPPTYRDFAYLAFTIGMTYQVSDTTLREGRLRRAVLIHAIFSYVFGIVIVSAGVNIVAGLLG